MSRQIAAGVRLASLVHWMAAQGLTGVDLEAKGDLLILRLPAEPRARLLGDEPLRREVVSQGKALGFARVALDLPPEEGGVGGDSSGEGDMLGGVGNSP